MIQCTEEGRFFIDVTAQGCPCGCLYCYIESIARDETVFQESEIATLPRRLARHPRFVPGLYGSLLAFGSHSDLFRTPLLFESFLFALQRIAPLRNPIQVATKQFVPSSWAARISQVRAFDTQIVAFIQAFFLLNLRR